MSMPLRSSQLTNGQHTGAPPSEAHCAADVLAGLLVKRADAPPERAREGGKLPAKIYPVMLATTLLTFATLRTGYQLFFSHQLFG